MNLLAFASAALLSLAPGGAEPSADADQQGDERRADEGFELAADIAEVHEEHAPWHATSLPPEALDLEPEVETFDPLGRIAVLVALATRAQDTTSEARPLETDWLPSTGAQAWFHGSRGPPVG